MRQVIHGRAWAVVVCTNNHAAHFPEKQIEERVAPARARCKRFFEGVVLLLVVAAGWAWVAVSILAGRIY